MPARFVDEARIAVRSGHGGSGSASLHREKYKPRGGPDGGDGGHGGSVVLEASEGLSTLAAYRTDRHHRASSGTPGGSNNRRGADADDLVLMVPVGTVVRDAMTGETLADLARPNARFVAARGGRGGRGNASLASAVDRAPNFAERGEAGEERELILELRLVADVGFIGPPNAGKSTLLGAISRARPKVGHYPFTTIDPSLGVVDRHGDRFVAADLPGLVEGAAEGRGLGTRFLRHAERCAVLAAVVDLVAPDPVADLEIVVAEVEAHSSELAERVRVVVGNKNDLPDADATAVASWAEARGIRYCSVSALERAGLEELLEVLAAEIVRAKAELGAPESFAVFRPVAEDPILVEREDDAFRVRSERVERLVSMTPMGNPRAVRHLQRRLRAMGVETALEREGIREGDEVRIGETAFEYFPEREDR